MQGLCLSTLPKTWVLDLDGTLVKHNGHLQGGDVLLGGVQEFFQALPAGDRVVILTSRPVEYREETMAFLAANHIRCDAALFGMPVGERILVNDRKPSGLAMAYALNKQRDSSFDIHTMSSDSSPNRNGCE